MKVVAVGAAVDEREMQCRGRLVARRQEAVTVQIEDGGVAQPVVALGSDAEDQRAAH